MSSVPSPSESYIRLPVFETLTCPSETLTDMSPTVSLKLMPAATTESSLFDGAPPGEFSFFESGP